MPRLIRSQILSLRERDFTQTSVLSGANTLRLVTNEYMPHTTPLIFSTFINNMAWAIGLEITLAILGLIDLTVPTLGTMLYWAINYQAVLAAALVVGNDADRALGPALYRPLLAVGQRQRIPGSAPAYAACGGGVMAMNNSILQTQSLKAFYVLDVYGKQKIVQGGQRRRSGHPGRRNLRHRRRERLRQVHACSRHWRQPWSRRCVSIAGRVCYRIGGTDVDVATLGAEEKRRLRLEYISYVPQGSMSVLNPVTRIKDTYRDFIESHVTGKSKTDAYELARGHLVELGLPVKVLDAYPHQLSGGMRQRVTIALATLLKPRIIIGDEPTTALDVVVQRGVVQLLKDVQQELQNTIILVTHDMGVHANIADRIGIMYAGKIVEEAPTDKIFGDPEHPYTQYLINSLPKFGDKSQRDSVPGSPPSLANLPSGCPFHPRCPHVMDVCKQQMPGFTKIEPGHRVACWLHGEGERKTNGDLGQTA